MNELLDGDVADGDDEAEVEYNGIPQPMPSTSSSQPSQPAVNPSRLDPAPSSSEASGNHTSSAASEPTAEGLTVDNLTLQLQQSHIGTQSHGNSQQTETVVCEPLQSGLSLTHLHKGDVKPMSEGHSCAAGERGHEDDAADAESDEADMFGFDTTPLTEEERAVTQASKAFVDITVRALKHVSKMLLQGERRGYLCWDVAYEPGLDASGNGLGQPDCVQLTFGCITVLLSAPA